jgi:hypothetical protein
VCTHAVRGIAVILHAPLEMVMQHVSTVACGYKGAIDLDLLRHDPLMKVTVGRCPETGVASQSYNLLAEEFAEQDRRGAAWRVYGRSVLCEETEPTEAPLQFWHTSLGTGVAVNRPQLIDGFLNGLNFGHSVEG